MIPTIPSNDALESALGSRIERRTVLRSTPLAVTERVEVTIEGGAQSFIVKTVIPELGHELTANQLVEDLEIGAAPLQASGEVDGHTWMAFPNVEANPDWELSATLLPALMPRLAELHASRWTQDQLAAFWDRSPAWFAANTDFVGSMLERLRDDAGASISKDDASGYLNSLHRLADATSDMPVTLVHGDFDPGNVVLARGEPKALDWGLAHVNLPTVDVAHMLLNFDPAERQSAFEAYRDAQTAAAGDAAWLRDADRAIRFGDMAHKAFFVWWHSTAVVHHGLDADLLVPVIRQRIRAIAEWAD